MRCALLSKLFGSEVAHPGRDLAYGTHERNSRLAREADGLEGYACQRKPRQRGNVFVKAASCSPYIRWNSRRAS